MRHQVPWSKDMDTVCAHFLLLNTYKGAMQHLKWVSDIRSKELEFEGKHIRDSIQWPQCKTQASFPSFSVAAGSVPNKPAERRLN